MNDNAKKWVAALRSGEYKQGFGVLKHYEKHCCLGVACVLFVKENPESLRVETTEGGYTMFGDRAYTTTLPPEVQQWLSLATPTGDFVSDNPDGTSLMGLNDTSATFDDIANVIATEPEGLFSDSD